MHNDKDAHLSDVDAQHIFALTRPDDKLLRLYVIYSLLANVGFLFAFIPLYFRFKTLRYRFDAEGVSVAHGILWRKESYLTYARIQDIHVSRNIFERWLGLGKVEIQTASGSTSAGESIEGVKEYNEIRNFLYARMRGHKLTTGVDVATEAEAVPVDAVLAGIRDELRAIRELAEAKRHV
ncbi:MAG TPA: PH domain-containing protein [Pyrinomonadaceae bacterium]|nr:PH domain-containing protein [Pyrinomonadaceae bacterium]